MEQVQEVHDLQVSPSQKTRSSDTSPDTRSAGSTRIWFNTRRYQHTKRSAGTRTNSQALPLRPEGDGLAAVIQSDSSNTVSRCRALHRICISIFLRANFFRLCWMQLGTEQPSSEGVWGVQGLHAAKSTTRNHQCQLADLIKYYHLPRGRQGVWKCYPGASRNNPEDSLPGDIISAEVGLADPREYDQCS